MKPNFLTDSDRHTVTALSLLLIQYSHSVRVLKSVNKLHVTQHNRPRHQLQQLTDCDMSRASSAAIIRDFATSSNCSLLSS